MTIINLDGAVFVISDIDDKLMINPSTNEFWIWKKDGWVTKGCSPNTDGYLQIWYEGRGQSAHRLIMRYVLGRELEKDEVVNHKNHVVFDNSLSNIEIVTHTQNMQFRQRQSNNNSGHMGVHFDKNRGKWRATIKINGKQKHLGSFVDKEDAIIARRAKVKELNTILNDDGTAKFKFYIH